MSIDGLKSPLQKYYFSVKSTKLLCVFLLFPRLFSIFADVNLDRMALC